VMSLVFVCCDVERGPRLRVWQCVLGFWIGIDRRTRFMLRFVSFAAIGSLGWQAVLNFLNSMNFVCILHWNDDVRQSACWNHMKGLVSREIDNMGNRNNTCRI